MLNFLKGHVTEFKFSPDRQKASGRMYGGSAVAVFGDTRIELKLWYHGSDEETEDSLREHLYPSTVNGCDSYWHCLYDQNSLWFHPAGWFRDRELESKVASMRTNNAERNRMPPAEELTALGFTRLI